MSGQKYFPVYVNAYVGGQRDHHGIFVELYEDKSGYLYHVEGSVQTGMKYKAKPASSPLDSASFLAYKLIGWVSESQYERIHEICSSITPPPKQYNGPKLLVPKHKLRRCQEWTNDVVAELIAEGVVKVGETEYGWVSREELEGKTTKERSASPKGKSKSSHSSSQSKSKPSSSSKPSSRHRNATSKTSSTSSSTSEPADGAVSGDGYWVYSKNAKDWYHMSQDGRVTWARQGKGKGH